MAEKPEDLNLPTAVITRMIKEVLPDGVNISKEARAAISKSASVFVLYATSCANNMALQNKRKTLTATDVLDAIEEMEFQSFIKPLKEALEVFKREQKEKKDAAEIKKKQKAEANGKIEAETSEINKLEKKNENEDDDAAIEVDAVMNIDESTNPYDADVPMPPQPDIRPDVQEPLLA